MNTNIIIAEKMVYGGSCIAKIDGKTVFVQHALPGEKLEIEIISSGKDYDTARIVSVIEPSPHRITPVCGLYGSCGGCNMQHIDDEYQRQLRVQMLKESFERAAPDLELPEIEVIHGKSFGYRNRFQLHDGGLKERAGSASIPLTACPVADGAVRSYIAQLTESGEAPSGRVTMFGSGQCVGDKKVFSGEEEVQEIRKKVTGSSKKKVKTGGKRNIYEGSFYNPEYACTVSIRGTPIEFDVRGFFQSNIEMLEKIIEPLCSNMGGVRLLDMYSGVGTLSAFASRNFNETYLVEHNRDAVVFAAKNMKNIKHNAYGMSGEKWVKEIVPGLEKRNISFDAVIIDPPRSGMEYEVVKWLCRAKPPVIRSLSCDPVTQSRDCARLAAAGYKITRIILADFYPQTTHIESLVFLEYCP